MARNAISSGKELISPYKIIAAKTDSLQQFTFLKNTNYVMFSTQCPYVDTEIKVDSVITILKQHFGSAISATL